MRPETLPGPARDAMGLSGPGAHFDTVVEGRASYDIGLAAGLTDAYPHLRHLVVSRTLADRTDLPVEVVAGDPVERVRELKAEDGLDIWLVGGGPFAHARFEPVDRVDLPGGVRVVTLDRVR